MWIIWIEEFRKIAARKIIWLATFLLLAFITLRLVTQLKDYTVTIDGKTLEGQDAVEADKALTKRYAGILTEKEVNELYGKYGFYPYDDPDNTELEKNYLNRFITDHFTGFRTTGNVFDLHLYEGEEWEQNAAPYLEENVKFDYVYGWDDCVETYILVLLVSYVILLIGLSPVFSEEYMLKTADILRTTKRGKDSAVWMKILAACAFVALHILAVSIYSLGIYLWAYGAQGLDASAVLLRFSTFYGYCPKTVAGLFLFIAALGLLGSLLLTGMTLGLSAACRNSFLSLVFSAAVFSFPVLWMKVLWPMCMGILGTAVTTNITHFISSMPAFLPMSIGFSFSSEQIVIHICIAAAVGTAGFLYSYYRYRRCRE